MPSQAYYEWLDKGRPYTLSRPCREFQQHVQDAGYVVEAYPDDVHLQAIPPEDHTPFSATGWPIVSQRWVAHAVDIMPAGDRMPLSELGARIFAAKRADFPGTQWIKYMNWTDAGGGCWHESWQPSYVRQPSTDRGHIHISARSDMDLSDNFSRSSWNPFTQGGSTMEVADILKADIDPTASQYSLGGALYVTLNRTGTIANNQLPTLIAAVTALGEAISTIRAEIVTPEQLAQALVTALAANPSVIDALATAVASRVGMIPTAQEIAKAIGELTWQGRTV